MRVLILGGSSEASALVRALEAETGIDALLSLAGRTAAPQPRALRTRTGGFGGVAGLVRFLRQGQFDILADATHPFAARMSAHAREAAAAAGVPLLRLTRPAWEAREGDRWIEVATMAAAAGALGAAPRRAFLTTGRLQLAAFAAARQHFYLVRTIDPAGASHGLREAIFIAGRGPFVEAEEKSLMQHYKIDVLVTKNSGGEASKAKLDAARALGLPVILVRRPDEAIEGVAGLDGPLGLDGVLAALRAHVVRRGE